MNSDDIKNKAWLKRYEDVLDELRRKSEARTRESISTFKSRIEDHSRKYDSAYEGFSKVVEEGQRQLGMESFSTLILQMGPSLTAFNKMSDEYKMYIFNKVAHKLAENINYNDFTPLQLTAEAARNMRACIDWYANTEGHFAEELPPVFVPYLAEVDDNGVLSVDLNVPNRQLREQDRRDFVNQYQTAFDTSIENYINAQVDVNGARIYQIETIPDEGKKIRKLPDPTVGASAAGLAAPEYMSKAEFIEFRTRSLQPHLEQTFQVEFQPESSRNMQRP